MIKKFSNKIKKSVDIFTLVLLIIITAISTSYFNYKKNINKKNYNDFIDNIYLKKTLNHIVNNLEPKYKKFNHQIKSGETFDKILNNYQIDKEEIIAIKNSISQKVNLNKMNTKQNIQFSLDQTNNKINEFTFQISNSQKIYLTRNYEDGRFNQKIISIKLDKKIIYKENIILQSLYKSATDQNIPANTIIEFARIYGFQVDFQRDIRKRDKFQIMYEVFLDEKKEIVEIGEILFVNLKLSGQDNRLYYFSKKESEGHYDKNGKSVQKALMKTPINGSRLSSSFGMRKHPIDGFNKMHRGTDTETQGRVHTSAATVAVLPEAEEVDLKINDSDLRIDVFRAGGPGGQSVNTTDSAVRITHIPTGLSVSQQDEKSQHKNKAKGMKILRSRLYELERSRIDQERSQDRKTKIGTGDRSERIRTYNFPQGRVTDHRINLTLHRLEEFLEGEAFDEMIESLTLQAQEDSLSNLK